MPRKKQPSASRAEPNRVLFVAWIIALILSGGVALALYLNPDWRRSEFAMVVEEIDEEGVVRKKVKVERPEPNEEQVREIARNQERKKRDELKREVKKMVEILRETDEVKEERKKDLATKTADDEAFRLAIEIEVLASQLRRAVRADPFMSGYEVPRKGSARTLEIATRLADKARADEDGVLSPEEAAGQIEVTEELVSITGELVEAFERGRVNLIKDAADNREKGRIRRELQDEMRLSGELSEKAEEYLAFIRALMDARMDAEEEFLPEMMPEQWAELGREMLEQLTDEQVRELEWEMAEADGVEPDEQDWGQSDLAEAASDHLPAGELADLARSALSDEEDLPFDPSALSEEQMGDTAQQALESYGQQAALEEMLAQYSDEALEQMTAHDLYETAQELGEAVNENFTEARAAELAAAQGESFEEALNDLYQPPMPESPDLSGMIGPQAPPPSNAQEFEAYNAALEQAARAAANIAKTAESRASQLTGRAGESGELSGEQLSQQMRARAEMQTAMNAMASTQGQPQGAMTDMTAVMAQSYGMSGSDSGNQFGDSGQMHSLLNRGSYEGSMGVNRPQAGGILADINTREIIAQSLPGRKFTDDSARKGWVFVDTWYVIGPWKKPPNAATSFDDKKFPPETLVDFDAEYPGQEHPLTKEPLSLKWRFVQSNRIRINPPDETTNSTYYAYTEVYADRPREVLLAVGTDDYAKIWINDLVVWKEEGLSSWQLDQGFRKVLLKEGYNKILVRLESGPGVAYFSLVLCPVDLDRS
ncbi:MAG: hypothetical protein ACLFRP_06750 [Puniceicoccaceae bacterium]